LPGEIAERGEDDEANEQQLSMSPRATVSVSVAAGLATAALVVTATVASSAPRPATGVTPCATGAGEVLANAAGAVAQRIYTGEARSSETDSDKNQIAQNPSLIAAVAGGEESAIRAAVHTLVYSHTHIVRLRVTRGSDVLADEGGPYILAPISGTLRSHGRAIASFVFSVQDDLGYVKLVARFIGAPLILRTDSGQVPIEGLLSPGPASIPDHGPLEYRHTRYQAYSFNVKAYPSGRLRVSLLVPVSAALGSRSCEQIKTAELGLIAERISRRFTPALSPSNFASYIKLTRTMTHGLVYIRRGSRRLAGSTPVGPSSLPVSGALRYRGTSYEVSSFATSSSVGQVRVYLLVAPNS
jgi:hypothetical protein